MIKGEIKMCIKRIKLKNYLFTAVFFTLLSINNFIYSQNIDIVKIPSMVWSLKVHDINNDGKLEYIYGSLGQDYVYCVNEDSKLLWKYNTKGIVNDIAIGNIDDSANIEIITASYNPKNTVYAFSSDGKKLWEKSFPGIVNNVAVGYFDSKTTGDVICSVSGKSIVKISKNGKLVQTLPGRLKNITDIACGDVSGNKKDDIVIADRWKGVFVFDKDGNLLLDTYTINNEYSKHSRGRPFDRASSITLADLDLDKKMEIILGSTRFAKTVAYDDNGKVLWKFAHGLNYINSIVKSGDITGDEYPEIVSLSWRHPLSVVTRKDSENFRIFDHKGNIIKKVKAPFALSAVAINKKNNKQKSELVFSSDFDDSQIFKFKNYNTIENDIKKLKKNNDIFKQLKNIKEKVDVMPARKINVKPVNIVMDYAPFLESREPFKMNINMVKKMSSENFILNIFLFFGEKGASRDDYLGVVQFETEKIIQIAKFFEKNNLNFILFFSHGGKVLLKTDTIKKICKIAPNTFTGIECNEDFSAFPKPLYFKWISKLQQVAEIFYPINKKIILTEFGQDFRLSMSDPKGYGQLFTEKYKNVFVPIIKCNNNKSIDTAAASLIGLWKCGLINDWGLSTQQDNWNWDQVRPASAIPLHLLCRMELSVIAYGGSWLRFEGGQPFIKAYRSYTDEEKKAGKIVYDPGAPYQRGLIHQMIKKRLIQPIDPDQLVNVSSVGIANLDILKSGVKISKSILRNSRDWVFGFPMTQLEHIPDSDLSKVINNRDYWGQTVFPINKYGLIAIIPEIGINNKLFNKIWITDGVNYIVNGQKKPANVLSQEVLESFKEASKNLPFTTDNCFITVHKFPNYYRLYLISPNYWIAEDKKCTIKVNIKTAKVAQDVILGEKFNIENGKFNITVNAGLFRIIDINYK